VKRIAGFVAVAFLILASAPAWAFFSGGDVPLYPGISYDDLKVNVAKGTVSGELENTNNHAVKVIFQICFNDLFEKVLASAIVVEIMPPNSTSKFNDYIKGSAKEADRCNHIAIIPLEDK
jgi:hypothetical protein